MAWLTQKPNFGLMFLPQHVARCGAGEAAATLTPLHFFRDISKIAVKCPRLRLVLSSTLKSSSIY